MTTLVAGPPLWAAHPFKRVLPEQRAALGKAGRAVVALAMLVSVGLMIWGYRAAEPVPLYDLPEWAWYANNLLMLAALFLMDAGRAKGIVRTRIRHPMLTGVLLWAAAHLLVNGELTALILFGGLGLWALVEMAVINRAEGAWVRPERGTLASDGKLAGLAVALYAAIAGIHYWLGYPVMVWF